MDNQQNTHHAYLLFVTHTLLLFCHSCVMLMHAGKTVEYWAYGGDFGSFPDDAQFCINGMIWPNREPHPGCFEAKAAMVTCTHTPHCPPYHLVLSTFSSAHVGFRWSPSIWSCSALTSCIQLICQIALIAACSHDDVLLLAWRYLASAQTEGSILVIATHMRQPVHCVLAAAVFYSKCMHAFHSTMCRSQRRQEAPLCPTRRLLGHQHFYNVDFIARVVSYYFVTIIPSI